MDTWKRELSVLRALDLFCGAGGATKGLQRAGFHVTGVDIKAQPRYVGDKFLKGDALSLWPLHSFRFIWASPPCQAHVRGLKNSPGYDRANHVDLIDRTRDFLKRSRVPYVIENVPGAPIRPDIILDGTMFPELRVIRERWFETSWGELQLGRSSPPRGLLEKGYLSIAGTGIQKWCVDRGLRFTAQQARDAMGIDWMTRKELSQAIPPAYSEFIGRAALTYINSDACGSIHVGKRQRPRHT